MSFLNPWGLLFAISIPGIIILYLLKPRHEDVIISSTFLWDRTIETMRANVPWQKLRANILLVLQILALALFTLGVSQPTIVGRGQKDHYIIILDSSASMQATDVKPSRFEKACVDIENIIDGMMPNQSMTLIEAASQASILANKTSDKSLLKAGLAQIKATNQSANIEEAFSLVQSLTGDEVNATIYLYTDEHYRLNDFYEMRYNTQIYNNNGQNRAVEWVTYSYNLDIPIVLSTIVNYGDSCTISVECLVDDRLVDVKEIPLAEGETANIYWDNISSDAQRVEISIIDEDHLMIDNKSWAVFSPPTSNKVLLVTSRNTFLEKALGLRRDLHLDKTTFDEAQDIEGYNLYVYDGYLPSQLPNDGSVILFNPRGDSDIITLGQTFKPGVVGLSSKTSYRDLTRYIQPEEIHIAEARSIEIPDWAQSVLDDGHYPIMMAGERGSQRIVIFPFDIHNSDLPLKPDFPILMQNIMEWMLPQVVDSSIIKYSGDEININPLPHASRVEVINPSGDTTEVAPPFPVAPFGGTQEVGIYKVKQVVEEKELEGYFTVHVPTAKESDLRIAEQTMLDTGEQKTENVKPAIGKNIWHYFIWAVLFLILVEWWVYQRGY